MKKTLVAVAAMAAVTGAMAQATISGFIDSAYNTLKSTTSAGVTTTTSSLASSGSGQSQITFGTSEDLGGGLKAFANLRIVPSPYAGTIGSDASEVGLSGDFGTFQLGRDYSIDHGVLAAADASGYTGGSKGVVNNGNGGATGNAVVYILPKMIPGVGIIFAKGVAGVAGGYGDSTNYKITYDTGGLSLQYAAGSASTAAVTNGQLTNFTIGGTTATYAAVTAGSKTNQTALSFTYDLGMAKLHYGTFSSKNSTDTDLKNSSNMVGVSIPFGATTVGITSSSAKRDSITAVSTKASGYRGKVSHALSKRTTAYAAYGTESVDNGTAQDKQTAFGLTHSF